MAYNPNQPNGRQVQNYGQGRPEQVAVDQALAQTGVDRSGGVDPSVDPQTRVLGQAGTQTSNTLSNPGGGQQTNPGASGQLAPAYQTQAINPGARTDQWSGKGAVTQRGNYTLEGFDHNNLADDNMQTAKYQNGRIFSRYDPNDPGGVAKLLADPEFRALFPNAKQAGSADKIDYGDGNPVDVIRGYGAPGAAWAWQPENENVGGGGGAVGGGNAMMGGGSSSAAPSALALQLAQQNGGRKTDTLSMIMQILAQNKLFDPNENFMLRNA